MKSYLVVPPVFEQQLTGAKVAQYTREQALKIIWRHTHKDFRGKVDGVGTIMVNGGARGGILVAVDHLTDEQINDLLPSAHKQELARLAKKAV